MSLTKRLVELLQYADEIAQPDEQSLLGWVKRLVAHQQAGDVIAPPPQSGSAQPDPTTFVGAGGTAPAPVVTAGVFAKPGDTANGMVLQPDFSTSMAEFADLAAENAANWGPSAGQGKNGVSWFGQDALTAFNFSPEVKALYQQAAQVSWSGVVVAAGVGDRNGDTSQSFYTAAAFKRMPGHNALILPFANPATGMPGVHNADIKTKVKAACDEQFFVAGPNETEQKKAYPMVFIPSGFGAMGS
jgi:hypothetical protein